MRRFKLCCCVVLLLGAVANAAVAEEQPDFVNPPEYVSVDGVLEATLRVAPGEFLIGDQVARTTVYNDIYTGPTLRVKPGDEIRLTLINDTDEPTNLHFHGMTVSPLYNGDNVRLYIYPGETFEYVIKIPEYHYPGLFWYHSHLHGLSQRQVLRGLSGALIVEGMLDPFPELAGIRERNIVLKNVELNSDGHLVLAPEWTNRGVRTVSGLVNPEIDIRPGETQFWRVSNQSANIYYLLSLEGHEMEIIGYDANRTNRVVTENEYLLGPSSRIEFLVTGGPEGRYEFSTAPVLGGPAISADNYEGAVLATMVSSGEPMEPRVITSPFPELPEPADNPVTAQRDILFTADDSLEHFFINGRTFDVNRVDVRVPLGSNEEWTIRNLDSTLHIFHIHQTDFQILEINGEPQEFTGLYDTVTVPTYGEAKILIPFDREIMIGAFVYHCHILIHEDKGMMGIVQVYDPENPTLGALPDWADGINQALNVVGSDLKDLPFDMLVDVLGEKTAYGYVFGNTICVAPS